MSTRDEQIVSAMRRADQAYYEQIADVETLEFGVAFCSPEFPESPAGNQLREVVLGDIAPDDAYESVERYYRQRGLLCRGWAPALGEPRERYDSLLRPRGWTRCDSVVLAMTDWPAPVDHAAVRILPARAMRRALRATFGDTQPAEEGAATAQADECEERLNDANYDVFVALVGDRPAGRIGYHEVGDIAALRDVYVVKEWRGRGVGAALMDHVIRLARRLVPRLLVVSVPEADATARRFCEGFGCQVAGTLAEWHRGIA